LTRSYKKKLKLEKQLKLLKMVHQLTYDDIAEMMNEKSEKFVPLAERTLTKFCAHFIYGKCGGKDCNRWHTNNIDYIRFLLEKDTIKKTPCQKGAHCRYFLCQYEHTPDLIVFGHTDKEDNNKTVFKYSEEEREKAKEAWKKEKNIAYEQELVSGARKPKNDAEKARLRKLLSEDQEKKRQEFLKTAEFPALSESSSPKGTYTGNFLNTESIQPNKFIQNIIGNFNVRLQGIASHFAQNPALIEENQMINQLFQLSKEMNAFINNGNH